MLDAAIKNSAIQNLIDYNLSIEDIGIFKPDPKCPFGKRA
jgi:hypothetical protein